MNPRAQVIRTTWAGAAGNTIYSGARARATDVQLANTSTDMIYYAQYNNSL